MQTSASPDALDFSTAGEWRIQQDPSLAPIVERIRAGLERVGHLKDPDGGTRAIGEDIVESFLDNPEVSNELLKKLASIDIEQVAQSDADYKATEERVPGHVGSDYHRYAAAPLAILLDAPVEEVMARVADLGISGTVDTVLFESPFEALRRGTVLHDTTDSLRLAGLPEFNEILYGFEGSVESALSMAAQTAPDILYDNTIGAIADGVDAIADRLGFTSDRSASAASPVAARAASSPTPQAGTTQDPDSLAVRIFRASFQALKITEFEDVRLALPDNRGIEIAFDRDTGAIRGESPDGRNIFNLEVEGKQLAFTIQDPEVTETVLTELEARLEAYRQQEAQEDAEQTGPEL